MNFTRENARNVLGAAEKKLISVFGNKVTGEYAASFTSVSGKTVVGACNLPYYAPIVVTMMKTADVAVAGAVLSEGGIATMTAEELATL